MSRKLPLGDVAVAGTLLAMVAGRVKVRMPSPLRWYLLFLALGTGGYLLAAFPGKDSQQLFETYKLVVIGVALSSLLDSRRSVRMFVIGYLALFALFPVRGALYNFMHGITHAGRIIWNFYFSNPNDLAMTCLLPIGLCGAILVTERGWLRVAAALGVPVLLLVVFLTQSRGVVLGIAAGGLYFLLRSREKMRLVLYAAVAIIVAALVAPQGVWDRMAGLSQASLADMSRVDEEKSAESRWAIMGIGLGIARDNPLVGVGIGNYGYVHALRSKRDPMLTLGARGYRDAHSMYIRSAAEAGFAGGLAIIAFVLASLAAVRKVRKRIDQVPGSQGMSNALLALEMSMVAFAVGGLFSSAERTTFVMLQMLLPVAFAQSVLADLPRGNDRAGLRPGAGSVQPARRADGAASAGPA
jgi:O-antigen ligase